MKALTGVSETLLLPLYAKYLESRRPDGIVNDEAAVAIVEGAPFDFSKFARMWWATQVSIAIRTEILDTETREFLDRRREAVVVNLGAGLCTRFSRVDDGRVRWIDLDLPEVEPAWAELFGGDGRREFIARSALNFSWMDEVGSADPASRLFIAEGLLMYFAPGEVTTLLAEMARRFPGSQMLLETVGPFQVRVSRFQPDVSKTSARFTFGIRSLTEIERSIPGVKVAKEWCYLDFHRDRWKWMWHLRHVPGFRYEMKLGRLELGGRSGRRREPRGESR